MPNRLVTTREVVDLLQLDRVTIYKMVKRGELPALRVGGQWRFSAEAIAAWLAARNGEHPGSPDLPDTADTVSVPRLTDLVPVRTLRSIQDQLAEFLGVSSFTIDTDGQPVIPCSRCSRFCQLVHSTKAGWAACVASWQQIAHSEQEGAVVHTCHAGIHYATAPIVVGGQRVGMVTAGQFLSAAVDPVTFRERALTRGGVSAWTARPWPLPRTPSRSSARSGPFRLPASWLRLPILCLVSVIRIPWCGRSSPRLQSSQELHSPPTRIDACRRPSSCARPGRAARITHAEGGISSVLSIRSGA
jgi:excisionase family DNA binding protein